MDAMAGNRNFAARYIVPPGKRINLSKLDPRDTGPFTDKDKTKADTAKA